MKTPKIEEGSVVRINNAYKRPGWRGALVVVTQVAENHLEGTVHHVLDDNRSRAGVVRLWKYEVSYVGHLELSEPSFVDATAE